MLKVISHYFPSGTVQKVTLDALLLSVAVVFAVVSQSRADIAWWSVMFSALCFALVMILMNSFMGLYRLRGSYMSARETMARGALSLVVSVPAALLVFQFLPWNGAVSRATQLSVIVLLCAVLLMRCLNNRRASASLFMPRVMVVGTGEQAAAVARALEGASEAACKVVGFYPTGVNESGACGVQAERVLSSETGLLDTVKTHRVNEIVVAVRERRGGVLPLRELLDCKMMGVPVVDLSSFYERTHGQVRLDSLRASWLIYGDGFRQGVLRTAIKRGFDVVCAVLLLLLALPVMLLTALLIVLEDGPPVFYRQERVGQGGRVFRVTKFRSMRRDAEKDGKPLWASADDDRMTRVGRVIRKLRIDELPQLLNVLAGDMSLVGPRPERPYFVDQLVQEVPFYAVRHCVKPGVTGWAQVRYQYGSSVDDAVQKLQYDLYYVKNHSLVLDVLILFETVRVVLLGEGAQ